MQVLLCNVNFCSFIGTVTLDRLNFECDLFAWLLVYLWGVELDFAAESECGAHKRLWSRARWKSIRLKHVYEVVMTLWPLLISGKRRRTIVVVFYLSAKRLWFICLTFFFLVAFWPVLWAFLFVGSWLSNVRINHWNNRVKVIPVTILPSFWDWLDCLLKFPDTAWVREWIGLDITLIFYWAECFHKLFDVLLITLWALNRVNLIRELNELFSSLLKSCHS